MFLIIPLILRSLKILFLAACPLSSSVSEELPSDKISDENYLLALILARAIFSLILRYSVESTIYNNNGH